MCNICFDQIWIIALDGTLKRCPVCSTPTLKGWQTRQLSLVEFGAAIHAIRLGVSENDDERNDDKHIEDHAGDDDPANAGDGIHSPAHFGAVQYANAARHHREYAGDKPVHRSQ